MMATDKCGQVHENRTCEKGPNHRGWHLAVVTGVTYEWIEKAKYKPEVVDW
jgi:hypothetical protein